MYSQPDDADNTASKMRYLCEKVGASAQKRGKKEQTVVHKKQMVQRECVLYNVQNFELTLHSPNVLFVAFENTNLYSDILKLYLGAFFLKIMYKSHHNTDMLV